MGRERLRQNSGDDDARRRAADAVRTLSQDGIKINFTAIFASGQVHDGLKAFEGGAPAIISVFAGRLADLGIDYRPIMKDAITRARATSNVEIIWASTREAFNVIEADEMGCHIITAPADVLKKLPAMGTKTGEQLAQRGLRRSATMRWRRALRCPYKPGFANGWQLKCLLKSEAWLTCNSLTQNVLGRRGERLRLIRRTC